VAAFYPLPRCLFYRVGRFHCGGFIIVFLRLPLGSQLKKVVHWMSEILFAAEIAFRRLHGYMPQQELNLLKALRRSCGTASHTFVVYAACGIVQSIFRSVAQLQVRNREENRGSRAGELKMDWTKPPRCRWRYGY